MDNLHRVDALKITCQSLAKAREQNAVLVHFDVWYYSNHDFARMTT